MTYKTCSKCGESKHLTEFNKKSAARDGHRPDCRVCHQRAAALWRTGTRPKRLPTIDRVLASFERGPGCWIWTGTIDEKGYGRTAYNGRTNYMAHRLVYELLVGPIPSGMTLDHLCHNGSGCVGGDMCAHRRCVNPAHLSPATLIDNTMRGESPHARHARQTHCKSGHEFTPENTRIDKRGCRQCRACSNVRNRELRATRRGAA